MVEINDVVWTIWEEKGNRTKNFDLPVPGDLNPWFSVIFPPMIWIFMECEELEIKSKQASKRDFIKMLTLKSAEDDSMLVTSLASKYWFVLLTRNAILSPVMTKITKIHNSFNLSIALIYNSPLLSNLSARPVFSLVNLWSLSFSASWLPSLSPWQPKHVRQSHNGSKTPQK